ncbi:hypothetical protein F4859DRAFT_501872 [Xylaria cf. heliscus]|nr:hypothetical protein F4859DRAFT_501872 [Xylaria cf. heliscus]
MNSSQIMEEEIGVEDDLGKGPGPDSKEYLESWVCVNRKFIQATPDNDPDLADYLYIFGTRLHLEEAIKVSRQAINMITPSDIIWHDYTNLLAVEPMARFSRTGNIHHLSDLDELLRISKQLANALPIDDPRRPALLHNFALVLHARFETVGMMEDVEQSIRLSREAIDLASTKDHNRPTYMSGLISGLQSKFDRVIVRVELEEAIGIAKDLVDTTPAGRPGHAKYLSILGNLYGTRYTVSKSDMDFEEALKLLRDAVDLSDRGPQQTYLIDRLADGLYERHHKTGTIEDLDEAIKVSEQAVRLLPTDHKERVSYLGRLGSLLEERYLMLDQISDCENAAICFREAIQQSNAPVIDRIKAGECLSRTCSDGEEACTVIANAVSLVPFISMTSLPAVDKQRIFVEVVGMSCDAAAILLQNDKLPSSAMILLEYGRGLLTASINEMRTDVQDLQESHPELAESFIRLRNEIERSNGSTRPGNSIWSKRHTSLEDAWADRRYETGQEIARLILTIRKKPGFQDFLLPPSEAQLCAAASRGPIAIINISHWRCDAILVEPHQVRSLPLPDLSRDDVENKLNLEDLGSLKVLEWLWDTIAKPVLDALGFTEPPTSSWPHIWWIPTGALSRYPLHAAGYHRERSCETVLDRVMSSYAVSIKVMISSRSRNGPTVGVSDQGVLVAMKDTPGKRMLPYATKEVDALRDIYKSIGLDPVEPCRRKQDVLSHIRTCKTFHFAGHGYRHKSDPLESQILLEDCETDHLKVADILEINIHENRPFLAYLSACDTAHIDSKHYLDESVHFLSAFSLAGFWHVIGTLWEVEDETCVDMAKLTYKGIGSGEMTDESVCQGLHNATRELRDRWLITIATFRGSSSVKRRRMRLSVGKMAGSTTIQDQGGPSRRRKGVLCDSDDEVDVYTGTMHWVPYVHFGV